MIYFARGPGDDGPIKIGFTSKAATTRIAQVEQEYSAVFVIIGVINGGRSKEAELHRRFSHLRLERELFEPAAELVDFIAGEALPPAAGDVITGRDDQPVKVERKLLTKAKLVAGHRGLTLAEYISELIRGPVEKDFARTIKEMGAGE